MDTETLAVTLRAVARALHSVMRQMHLVIVVTRQSCMSRPTTKRTLRVRKDKRPERSASLQGSLATPSGELHALYWAFKWDI